MPSTSIKKPLIWIAIASLVVKLLYLFQHITSPFFGRPLLDQHYYDLCARQLAGGGGELIDGFRPLLYPLFISCFYRLDLDSGVIISLIAQHIMGIGMIAMAGILAAKLFNSNRAGLAAAVIFGLSGPPLYFESQLLITTFFSFLLLIFWLVLYEASEAKMPRKSVLLWLTSGIVLGLAAQARPNALPLLLIFPLITFYRLIVLIKGAGSTKRQARPIAIPLLGLVGILGIQIIFGAINARYSGHFSLMTQAGGINLYLGNARTADGMIPRQDRHVVYEGEYLDPIQVMAVQGYQQATGIPGEVSQKAVSDYWKDQTIEEIKTDPTRWLKLMMKKTWLVLWNHEVPNNRSYAFAAQEETPILKWLPVRWWLLLALLPWGMAALYKYKNFELLTWTSAFFIIFSGTIILFFVNSRFRIPLWPGMAIFAGGGVIHFWSCIKDRKIPICPTIGSGLLMAASCINWFSIPPDPIENDLSMRASIYYELGQLDEALQDIQQCAEIAPNNPRYHFIEGNIYLVAEQYAHAISCYLQAISLESSDPMFHNNLGIALESSGELDKAEMAYRNAIKLQPTYNDAKLNLTLLLIRLGDLDQAELLLAEGLEKNPHNSLLLCAEAVIEYRKSNNSDALQRARRLNEELTQQLLEDYAPLRQ